MLGALTGMWKNRAVSRQAKVLTLESIVAPAVIYGTSSDCRVMNGSERKHVAVMKMRDLKEVNPTSRR